MQILDAIIQSMVRIHPASGWLQISNMIFNIM